MIAELSNGDRVREVAVGCHDFFMKDFVAYDDDTVVEYGLESLYKTNMIENEVQFVIFENTFITNNLEKNQETLFKEVSCKTGHRVNISYACLSLLIPHFS